MRLCQVFLYYFCVFSWHIVSFLWYFCQEVRQLFLYYQVKRRNCPISVFLLAAQPPGANRARSEGRGAAARKGGWVGICRDIAQNTSDILCQWSRSEHCTKWGFCERSARGRIIGKKAAQRAAVIRPRASVAVGVAAAQCRSRPRRGRRRRLRAAAD